MDLSYVGAISERVVMVIPWADAWEKTAQVVQLALGFLEALLSLPWGDDLYLSSLVDGHVALLQEDTATLLLLRALYLKLRCFRCCYQSLTWAFSSFESNLDCP